MELRKMSDQPNKLVTVVARLMRLTQEGVIRWRREELPEQLIEGGDVVNFYVTEYDGYILGIYEKKYKPNTVYEAALSGSPFHKMPEREVVLAFFSRNLLKRNAPWLEKEWEFPPVAGLENLFRAVVFQVADVGSFIDKILEDSQIASA